MKEIIYNENLFGKEFAGITNGDIIVKECDNKTADDKLCQVHYSKKTTKNRFKSFSVNGNKGFLQLGYGIRPRMKHTISKDITKDNYCEFDRMWLDDSLPKFSESKVIGLLLRYIKQAYPKIKFVITYADGSAGNIGIIYQATNAFYVGKIKVDFYVLASGERVHPVSMWHRHKTRAWKAMQELYPGIKHITDNYQYRYLYILNKTMKKKHQKEVKVKSYPIILTG